MSVQQSGTNPVGSASQWSTASLCSVRQSFEVSLLNLHVCVLWSEPILLRPVIVDGAGESGFPCSGDLWS